MLFRSITEANTTNNTSNTVTTSVTCTSGSTDTLNIRKTDNRTVAYAGDALRYEIALDNTGSTDIQNIQVTDPIPSDLIIITVSDGGTISGQTITWNNITIPARQTKYLYVDTRVSSSATTSRTLTNTATARDTSARTKSATDTTLIDVLPTPYQPPYIPPYQPPVIYQPVVYPLTGGSSTLFSAKIDNSDVTPVSAPTDAPSAGVLSSILAAVAALFGIVTSAGKSVVTGSFL